MPTARGRQPPARRQARVRPASAVAWTRENESEGHTRTQPPWLPPRKEARQSGYAGKTTGRERTFGPRSCFVSLP
eukprot:2283389-Pleurochrysis_carterae.AAC.3